MSTHEFELAWQDDFNSTSLDTSKWYYRYLGPRHDGYNDTTTVEVANDNLFIKVYTDTVDNAPRHHTGMIATHKRFTYGKFEARVAFTNVSGSWSAFWLQSPTMGNPIGDPENAGMEIDVVETLSSDGRVHHNLHWDGYSSDHKTAGYITGDKGANSGNYHIYTFEWTPDYYKFYVDGEHTWTYSGPISQTQEYVILSSEVKNYNTGTWAGPIPSKGYGSLASSSTIMKVDYVKWYELSDTSAISPSNSIDPVADTWVRSSYPDRNYGAAGYVVSEGSQSNQQISYFKFDISDINQSLSGAKLKLYSLNDHPGTEFRLYRINDTTWIEGNGNYLGQNNTITSALTWNNAPTESGTLLTSVSGAMSSDYIELEITDELNNSLTDSLISFKLVSTNSQYHGFRSGDYSTSSRRPQIEYSHAN
ncbi:CBM96 family carbohydrate-binding protein [Fodinibius salsisoli]|uniref:Glycoside hydrolase family 16 protein n=1 Tax=Fodinibius salsisoli TaxID=2820877 RepID=A0ABT3PJM4_9BACT|nr:family 16 glycosylhydrolase [Fodinibius salsisoli]MCW9706075.1 glycoside hydrolase family 16 protein [Fodinibius salsisoli]